MASEVYQVGLARADITPPVGIRLIGYTVREGVSVAVDEPLTATVLVVRGSGGTVAIVAHDWALAFVSVISRLRERCGRALGIPPGNVLINLNHTHSAPVVPEFIPYDTPEQLKLQHDHAEAMSLAVERACREAAANLEPARMAVGWGQCRANINRREQAADGTVLMGENPNGACDSSVGVIRFDRLDGSPLAILFRYSCHTVTLGPKTHLISPDFVGPCRALIERTLGCPSLFLQGCAGNLNPITGIGQDPDASPHVHDDKNRLGQMLGGAVLEVAATLRTQRRRKEPELVHSLSPYWLYQYADIPPGPEGKVRVATTELQLPLTPFPPLDEVRRERAGVRRAAGRGREERGPRMGLVGLQAFRLLVRTPLAGRNEWPQSGRGNGAAASHRDRAARLVGDSAGGNGRNRPGIAGGARPTRRLRAGLLKWLDLVSADARNQP